MKGILQTYKTNQDSVHNFVKASGENTENSKPDLFNFDIRNQNHVHLLIQ